jgi:hypothetical protein
MKERDTFGSELKEKLNDYRCHLLSLEEIIHFLDDYYRRKKPFIKQCDEFTKTYKELLKKKL